MTTPGGRSPSIEVIRNQRLRRRNASGFTDGDDGANPAKSCQKLPARAYNMRIQRALQERRQSSQWILHPPFSASAQRAIGTPINE